MALYRKYRPATFAEVVGQEHVTEPLSTALDTGRISHAYLFSGPRGCGKTSSARILARSLNCVEGPTSRPCGVCPSCVALGPGGPGNLDVIELDAASHGGVDDTRELRDRAFYAPAESRYRVFIVDEAHMVTTAGFNALLKIVEEPPAHLIFVFATTEPDKVLPTIRSRTHHYPFRLLPPATMRGLLGTICEQEGVPVEEAVYPLVIRAGGGSPRDSLSVLDQLLAGAGPEGVTYPRALSLLGVTDIALIDDAIEALATDDGAALFGTVDRVVEAGHDPRRFAGDLLERMRDLILLRAVPDAADRNLVTGPGDVLERMRDQAQRLGPAALTRYAELLHEGLGEMRGATAPRLLLEVICARMLLPIASDSESATLQRLERLERQVAGGAVAPVSGAAASTRAPVSSSGESEQPREAPAERPQSGPPRRRGAEALAAIRENRTGGTQSGPQQGSPSAEQRPHPAQRAQSSGPESPRAQQHPDTAAHSPGGPASTGGSNPGAGQAPPTEHSVPGSPAGGHPEAGSPSASRRTQTPAQSGHVERNPDGNAAQQPVEDAAPQDDSIGTETSEPTAFAFAPGMPEAETTLSQPDSTPGTSIDPSAATAGGAQHPPRSTSPRSFDPASRSARTENAGRTAQSSGASVDEFAVTDAASQEAGDPGGESRPVAASQDAQAPMSESAAGGAARVAQGVSDRVVPSEQARVADVPESESAANRAPRDVSDDGAAASGQARAAGVPGAGSPDGPGAQAGDGVDVGTPGRASMDETVSGADDSAYPAGGDEAADFPDFVEAVVPQDESPGTAGGASGGDALREVEAAWLDIRAKVREFGAAVHALLSGASVARLEGETVVLAHQHAPLAQRLANPKYVEAVQSAIHAVLGRRYEVRWEVAGASSGAARPEPPARPQPASGRGGPARSAEPPKFTRPSQARGAASDTGSAPRAQRPTGGGADERSGRSVNRTTPASDASAPPDDDIPLPDGPDLPDDPGPMDYSPVGYDGVPPASTPEEEREMLAESAHPVPQQDRRDPDEVALELLSAELGATRLEA